MKVIDNWLNGKQNFYVGAAIYKTVGKDAKLVELFAKGSTAFAQQQLKEALTKLNTQTPAKDAPLVVNEETGNMPDSDEAVLKAIREEWLVPYKKMVYLRHSLDQYQGNSPEMIEKRKPIAFEILELEQQCIKLWKKRDYYIREGKLAEHLDKTFEIPTDAMELGRYIETVKRNIRRNKKNMADLPGKPIYAKLYLEYLEKYRQATGKEYMEA